METLGYSRSCSMAATNLKRVKDIKAKEVLKCPAVILPGTATLEEAKKALLDSNKEEAVLVGKEKAFAGVVTYRKLSEVLLAGAAMQNPAAMAVEKNIDIISADDGVEQLLAGEGPWPVLENNRVLGIITRREVAESLCIDYRSKSDRLMAVINSIHNCVITIDRDGRIDLYNRAAERLLEVDEKELQYKKIGEVFKNSRLVEVLRTGRKEYAQKLMVGDKLLLSNRTPIFSNGRIVGAVAVLQDISELESISRELKSTRHLMEELKAVIEHSSDGIYLTDGSGKTLQVNKAYEKITGIEASEVIGKNMANLVEEGLLDQSVTLLVLEKKEPVTIIQEIKRTGKTVLVTGNPIFDAHNNIFRVVTNVRDITELNNLTKKLEEAKLLSKHYEAQLEQYKIRYGRDSRLIVKSTKMEALVDLVMRLSQVDTTVIIQGESGVGKELIADMLHQNSRRHSGPFVKVNCGAIPENLLESELFGYKEGAFTGAKRGGKPGLFETARRGSIFLDEIGDMPLSLQVKLLRVLQDREIIPVGGTKPVKVDVRIVAATNRSLESMVKMNKFREDLYYRLNVVPVHVPPLRERKEEIPPLVACFLDKYNKRYGVIKKMAPELMDILIKYSWPGNVRELENVVERLMIVSSGDIMNVSDLPSHIALSSMSITGGLGKKDLVLGSLKESMESVEKEMLLKAFEKYGTTRRVARVLGISQPSVVRKSAKYGIKPEE